MKMIIPKDKASGASWGVRGWVTVTLYGVTKKEVDTKHKNYFNEFHPCGYDTHTMVKTRKHEDGYWFTTIRRWSTCD